MGSNASNTKAAWEEFVSTGVIDNEKVSQTIGDSWSRCRTAGVDPFSSLEQEIAEGDELERLLHEKSALIAAVHPFMVNLHNFVSGSGFVVILSDNNGRILVSLADGDICRKADDIRLVPGSQWLETMAGTNGIGTCLALGEPVQISGEEHYCQKIHDWTCSAAPICNQQGQVAAVLQMSGPSALSHKHTLGMVVAAAKAIEELLHVQRKNSELTMVNSRLTLINSRIESIFKTMSDGVIVVDPNGLVEQVNPSAERILCLNKSQMLGRQVEEVFQDLPVMIDLLRSGRPFNNIEIVAELKKGHIHCLVSGEALKKEHGEYLGGAIIVSPINKIKKLVNRFSGAEARFEFKDIIGDSAAVQEAVRIAAIAAGNESNVLLEGESGTGKEVFAQAIHNGSQRRDGPFVALNCAAIPRELMGSELFGYAEGSFTGASRGGRPGKFELASGGTLFLDEIGDMTQGKQGSLLRAIQERKIVRIGDNKVIPVDVRIICATNKNLRAHVEKGSFREDLYYRLNVITIKLPPLREHPEDIARFFEHSLEEICARLKIPIRSYEPDILPALEQYSWPGNARELQNVVERMVCIAQGGVLKVRDLPIEIITGKEHPPVVQAVDSGFKPVLTGTATENETRDGDVGAGNPIVARERELHKQRQAAQEQKMLYDLLSRCGGNITMAAREMGISRSTIYRKIKQFNLNL